MFLLASVTTVILATLFIFVSVLMMLVILIQRPKGGGLSGAFGGAGGSAQAAFGAKTGDFLTWTTCVFFVLFLGLAMGLTWTIRMDVHAAQQSSQTLGVTTPAGDAGDPPAAPDAAAEPTNAAAPTAAEVVEEGTDRSTSPDEAQPITDNAGAAETPAAPPQ